MLVIAWATIGIGNDRLRTKDMSSNTTATAFDKASNRKESTPKPVAISTPTVIAVASANTLASANAEPGTNNLVKSARLTFDDGPDPVYTPLVLEILKLNNIKATFFLIGKKAEAHPELVTRISEAGHLIGNHSYEHIYEQTYSSNASFKTSVIETQKILSSLCGVTPKHFRPPGGTKYFGNECRRIIDELGLEPVLWNISTGDGNPMTEPAVMVSLVRSRISAPAAPTEAIVLFHDDRPGVVIALQQIINELSHRGYSFTVLDDSKTKASLNH